MTLIKFTKDIVCKDASICSKKIHDAITSKVNGDIINLTSTKNGHISIDHKQNNHTIWLFLYSKDGEHEGEKTDKQQFKKGIIKKIPKITQNKQVKKYTGNIPDVKTLKNSIK
tara:strand:- start:241 stop:579 length:339 start_codon:yes stop_codon:yes gene_type:complete